MSVYFSHMQIIDKSQSPFQKIKSRFRKNTIAMISLFFILAWAFAAVFCYVLVPDKTPDTNRMNLAISNQPPGFKVTVLKFKRNEPEDETFFLKKIFMGWKSSYDEVAVSSFRIDSSFVVYSEYSATGDKMPEQKITTADALYALNPNVPVYMNRDALYEFIDGTSEAASYFEMKNYFLKENVSEKKFLLGTDRFGRDLLSRIIAGSRITLSVGLIAVIISLLLGIFFGSVAGYFGSKTDQFVMWLMNIIWSIPTLLLVISITLVLGKGFTMVFVAVGFTMWVDVARIVRAEIISISKKEFVQAAQTMGFKNYRIILHHILPNIMGPVLVVAAGNFATAVLLESGLSFLGIGAQPPTPSWGSMIKDNYGYIIMQGYAYLAILPGLTIMLLTIALTFVANGLRDAIDSRQQVSVGG